MKLVKISQLPLAQSIQGLFTLGVNANNQSVKVPLEGVDNSFFEKDGGVYTRGSNNSAEGDHSFVVGKSNSGNAKGSFVTGLQNVANGIFSFVSGLRSTSNNTYQFVHGLSLLVNNMYEVAFGFWNKSDENTIFSIGIGSGAKRSNAFEVKRNGDIYIMMNGEQVMLQDVIMQLPETGSNYGDFPIADLDDITNEDYYYSQIIGTIDDYDNSRPIGSISEDEPEPAPFSDLPS